MTAIPISPAIPVSNHRRTATMNVSTGAVHKKFRNTMNISKRLTSFDSKFITLPVAVSPRAVCDSRRAFEDEKKLCCIFKIKNKTLYKRILKYKIDLLFDKPNYILKYEFSFRDGAQTRDSDCQILSSRN